MPRSLLTGAALLVALALPGAAMPARSAPASAAPPDPGRGALLAPVVAADGTTMTGPDGRERCVVIGPPPPASAAMPSSTAADPGAYQAVQGGVEMALVDRPLTLADSVPCR